MMYGLVDQNCEIKLRLVISNGESERQTIDVLLDTGFTGYLTLPVAVLDRLNLHPYHRELGTLGDGSQCAFDVYRGFIIWDGTLQEIDINASESTPLIGMAMLYGYHVKFDAIEGGTAIIQAINFNVPIALPKANPLAQPPGTGIPPLHSEQRKCDRPCDVRFSMGKALPTVFGGDAIVLRIFQPSIKIIDCRKI